MKKDGMTKEKEIFQLNDTQVGLSSLGLVMYETYSTMIIRIIENNLLSLTSLHNIYLTKLIVITKTISVSVMV